MTFILKMILGTTSLSIVSGLLTFYIISVIILLILENRDPDKTIAWILVMIFLPVVGFIIYFYLGQNWKKKRIISYFQTAVLSSFLRKKAYYTKDISPVIEKGEIKTEMEKKIVECIKRSVDFGITTRNNVEFYFNGADKFNALISELKKAKKYIHMEYYRVIDDKYGRMIRDILIEKASKGIEVKALFDFYGSFMFLRKYQVAMQKAGVDIHSFFNPLRLFNHYKTNYRTHRKLVIIDGRKAFIGGMNVSEDYVTGGKRFDAWKDMHLKVEGEAVYQLQTIFLYDWYLNRKKSIIDKKYYPKVSCNTCHSIVQAVYSGPESPFESIKQTYFIMISNASKSIWIATPYFIPDESLTMALKNAALGGVDVKVIVPSKHDHYIPFHASRTYFEDLMKAGVEFYEFTAGFMHAKCFIADSTVASIGSANLDTRGMLVNFEANVVLYSKDDVEKLSSEFKRMLSLSRKIDLEKFKKRPIHIKLQQSIARLFSPIL